ncbi:MAG: acyl carrier protein [Actinomycetia bacterium]|nr:acyl carrier protein [Actinomycetes bacterium]
MTQPSETDVRAKLTAFIRESFLAGDPNGELEDTTPLLEWGVLDSLKVAMLLNFLRGELGVVVPFGKMSGPNFRDVNHIVALVLELSPAEPAAAAPAGAAAAVGD